ncbi:hypothetical protein MHYP_G00249970 [Metynnis hypsauchen]
MLPHPGLTDSYSSSSCYGAETVPRGRQEPRIPPALPAPALPRPSCSESRPLSTSDSTVTELLKVRQDQRIPFARAVPKAPPFSLITSSVPLCQHRLSLDDACISELRFWLFLFQHWNGISFFYEDAILVPEDLQLFTHAARSISFGCYWFSSPWPPEFALLSLESGDSSALRELYPVVNAALLWGHEYTGRVILIHSDNSAVIHIINKGHSNSLKLMPFICHLTWHSVQHQLILRAIHISGHSNAVAHSLSYFQFQKFKALSSQAESYLTPDSSMFKLHPPADQQFFHFLLQAQETILSAVTPYPVNLLVWLEIFPTLPHTPQHASTFR